MRWSSVFIRDQHGAIKAELLVFFVIMTEDLHSHLTLDRAMYSCIDVAFFVMQEVQKAYTYPSMSKFVKPEHCR